MPEETSKIKFKTPEQNGDANTPAPEQPLVNESEEQITPELVAKLRKEIERLDGKNSNLHDKINDLKEENKTLHKRALEAERKNVTGTVAARSMRIFVELLNGAVATGELSPKSLQAGGGMKALGVLIGHYAGVAQVAEAAAKEKGF